MESDLEYMFKPKIQDLKEIADSEAGRVLSKSEFSSLNLPSLMDQYNEELSIQGPELTDDQLYDMALEVADYSLL